MIGLFISESTYIPGVDENISLRAEEALAVVAERAKESGVTSACVSMTGDAPQDAIFRFFQENGCDLIVMGTHGRSRVGKFFWEAWLRPCLPTPGFRSCSIAEAAAALAYALCAGR